MSMGNLLMSVAIASAPLDTPDAALEWDLELPRAPPPAPPPALWLSLLLLLTAVFGIDPDANVSLIDEQVVKEVSLRTYKGPHRLDETDTQQPRFYAEVLALEIGALIIEHLAPLPRWS